MTKGPRYHSQEIRTDDGISFHFLNCLMLLLPKYNIKSGQVIFLPYFHLGKHFSARAWPSAVVAMAKEKERGATTSKR